MSHRISAISRLSLCLPSLLVLITVGCGGPKTVEETDPEVIEIIESDVVIAIPEESPADRASGFIVGDDETADETADDGGAAETDNDAAAESSSDADDEPGLDGTGTAPTLEKADVGVGKKGRGYGGGLISEPAKQYFSIREKTVFQVQIPQALNMYKALHGSLPKDNDTFMKSIVKENNIALPELPDGKKYVYDPKEGELMVQSGGEDAPE